MTFIADTPKPPYYAVIFSNEMTNETDGYAEMAQRMLTLASQQDGFLGVESARENIGITVSYWSDLESIKRWKAGAEHQVAQQLGHSKWYAHFKTRIAKVEKDYGK